MVKHCPCGKKPSYNLPGKKGGKWCTTCVDRPIEAVILTFACNCGKRPLFNLLGETVGKWCVNCKPGEAINVVSKKCVCGKHQPRFNLENQTVPIWCHKCPEKPKEAFDVLSYRCKCGKIPSFNLPGQKKSLWCSTCIDKPIEAININGKKCKCGKSPTYNLLGETVGRWCVNCKSEDALDVVSKRCMCKKHSPIYNLPGETVRKWCVECKPKGAIDARSVYCKECNLTRVYNPSYEGLCTRCFIHIHPDKPNAKNYKIKENHVFDELIKHLPNDMTYIRDKKVGGCSKRRPDLMIELGSHWICAENDENSHKDYDTTCENKRIMELYTDMANRPMVLVRFNCDKYEGGPSLFRTCKQTGISVIKSQKNFETRISNFAKTIKNYLTNIPEKAITVEYLYYN
jgi:hypothetical protein